MVNIPLFLAAVIKKRSFGLYDNTSTGSETITVCDVWDNLTGITSTVLNDEDLRNRIAKDTEEFSVLHLARLSVTRSIIIDNYDKDETYYIVSIGFSKTVSEKFIWWGPEYGMFLGNLDYHSFKEYQDAVWN